MDEKESTKITIPPLSIDEEDKEATVDLYEAAGSEEKAPQEEAAESVDPAVKLNKPTEGLEKGVLQKDLFNAQRLLNEEVPRRSWRGGPLNSGAAYPTTDPRERTRGST